MVHTIGPVGYGWKGWKGCLALAVLFTVALLSTSIATGLACSLITFPIRCACHSYPELGLAGIGFLSCLLAASDLGFLRLGTPETMWQVPRHWILRFSPPRMALIYGGYLGVPFITHVEFKSTYTIFAGCFLLLDDRTGFLAFALFGVGRALSIFLLSIVRTANVSIAHKLLGLVPAVRQLTGAAYAWLGGFLTIVGFGSLH